MKINNINYNSNPAFGSGKLIVKGPDGAVIKFVRALEGGFLSQQGDGATKVNFNVEKTLAQIAMETDSIQVAREIKQRERTGIKDMDGLWASLFKGADEIDLTKPLRLFIEGSATAVTRFINALRGGLKAQDFPVEEIIRDHGKRCLLIGQEDIDAFHTMKKSMQTEDGLKDCFTDESAQRYNAYFFQQQVIHLTD